MSSYFLVQVNSTGGYPNITANRKYENDAWMRKPRDKDQGAVEPGDTMLVYCTADILAYPMSLAFQIEVLGTTPDHVTLNLGEPRWFPNPLKRERILDLVDTGQLDEVFRSCGAQGFNIRRLEADVAQKVLAFLQGESANSSGSTSLSTPAPVVGSPVDRLIETKLEQWLVEHWKEVNFGSRLKLYEEDGSPVGQQYDTHVVGRIDLLCKDEDSGDLVIIELKRGKPSDEVVGQLARYIGWAQRHIANGSRVRGIILAPEIDDKLRYAASAIPDTTLLRYQTRFEVFVETWQPQGLDEIIH